MDKRELQIETGIQLLSRLSRRPSIEGLESVLFTHGPFAQETVEISGNSSSGKTLLLTQLVAKCILPSTYNTVSIQGRGIAVVLINTDHHFRVSKLVQVMHGIISKAYQREQVSYSARTIRELIIIPSLESLSIVNCYDNSQFQLALNVLDGILMKDPRIGLIALDGISSFYWQERETARMLGRRGAWLIDQYLKDVLKIIQKYVFQYKIVMVYTKPNDFVSKTQGYAIEFANEPAVEKINYRINFDNETRGMIETTQGKTEIRFKIEDTGITWIMER